jgi:H+/Cl- antiporter ClcA
MTKAIHPEATHHLPFFITPPGETDILMNVMIVFLALIVFLIGILYLRLHALPEHMAHRTEKIQYEVVAVLALISLFTHNHLYWILGLLLALVQIPDFSTPLSRMADSLATMAGLKRPARTGEPPAQVWPQLDQAQPAARDSKDLSHA